MVSFASTKSPDRGTLEKEPPSAMAIRGFTWFYFSFVGLGIGAFLALLIFAGIAPYPAFNSAKVALATFGLGAVGCGFIINCACGIMHKKMWIVFRGIGGLSDASWSWLVMHFAMAAALFIAGLRIWNGIVPVKL